MRQRWNTTSPSGCYDRPPFPWVKRAEEEITQMHNSHTECVWSAGVLGQWGIYALIDSPFAMFGLERGPQSLWLLCTRIAHIFHDCVGYRAANYMCSPLSAALAMASFFSALFVLRQSCWPFFFWTGFWSCMKVINLFSAKSCLDELFFIVCLLDELIEFVLSCSTTPAVWRAACVDQPSQSAQSRCWDTECCSVYLCLFFHLRYLCQNKLISPADGLPTYTLNADTPKYFCPTRFTFCAWAHFFLFALCDFGLWRVVCPKLKQLFSYHYLFLLNVDHHYLLSLLVIGENDKLFGVCTEWLVRPTWWEGK